MRIYVARLIHVGSLASLLLVGIDASRASAQQRVAIEGPPECELEGCRIVLEHVRSLGDREGPGYVGHPTDVARTPSGDWLVAHQSDWNRIFRFDSEGRFLGTIGRSGGGPGEYNFVSHVSVSGDTVKIFDVSNNRLTLLDGSFAVLSTRRFEIRMPQDIVHLPSGQFVGNASVRRGPASGFPLHVLDASGNLTRSFGVDDPGYTREWRDELIRSLWKGTNERIWSAQYLRYVLELWSVDGARELELTVSRPWFPGRHETRRMWDAEIPPDPAMLGVREDSNGMLWTLAHVADENWQNGLAEEEGPYGRPTLTVGNPPNYFDSVLEVIDVGRQKLVASERYPHYFTSFVGEEYVVSYREDPDGYPFIDIWRVRLETDASTGGH